MIVCPDRSHANADNAKASVVTPCDDEHPGRFRGRKKRYQVVQHRFETLEPHLSDNVTYLSIAPDGTERP